MSVPSIGSSSNASEQFTMFNLCQFFKFYGGSSRSNSGFVNTTSSCRCSSQILGHRDGYRISFRCCTNEPALEKRWFNNVFSKAGTWRILYKKSLVLKETRRRVSAPDFLSKNNRGCVNIFNSSEGLG